jgi:hypothetical protein
MEAINLLIYCFAALGLSYVLGFSKLSKPFREMGAKMPITYVLVLLVECPACLGFWIGVAAVAFRFAPLPIAATIWHAIYFGLFTAGTNLFLALRSGLIEGARS